MVAEVFGLDTGVPSSVTAVAVRRRLRPHLVSALLENALVKLRRAADAATAAT